MVVESSPLLRSTTGLLLMETMRLPEEGNHQLHTLEVFNHTSHKVMKDAVSCACIQANNACYREVLGQKMNKMLSSSIIYLTKEQYSQVMVSKSFIFNI
jgi:hypothetical protein